MNDFETYKQKKKEAAADAFFAGAKHLYAEDSLRTKNGLNAVHSADDYGALLHETGYLEGFEETTTLAAEAANDFKQERNAYLLKTCPDKYLPLKEEWDKTWKAYKASNDEDESWDLMDKLSDLDDKITALYDMSYKHSLYD